MIDFISAYGPLTDTDGLWQKAGSDVVLFELYERLAVAEGEYAELPDDSEIRPYAEACLSGMQLGVSLHVPESSVPDRVLRYMGSNYKNRPVA